MPQQPPPQRPDHRPYPDDGRTRGLPPRPAGSTPPSGAVDPRLVGGSGRHATPPPGSGSAEGPGGRTPGQGYGRPGATPPGGSGPAQPGATPPTGGGAVPPGPPWSGPGGPTQAFPGSTATPSGAATTLTAAEKKKGDLTVSKVLGGAGAAAASAVAGSFFGALGTISGAAAGAVFSSIVTELVQRSYDKTRDTVKARVKLPGGRTVDVEGKTDVPAPVVAPGGEIGTARVTVTPGDAPTELMSVVPPAGAAGDRTAVLGAPRKPSRRHLLVMGGLTVVVFALAMLAITGLELVKGSPLNASRSTTDRGTSLGSVLGGQGRGAATDETADEDDATTAERRTKAPADEESTEATSSDDDDEPSAESTRGGGGSSAPTASRSPRVAPSATPEPGSGAGAGAGTEPNAQSGGATRAPQQQ